jgi:hypothetical protein
VTLFSLSVSARETARRLTSCWVCGLVLEPAISVCVDHEHVDPIDPVGFDGDPEPLCEQPTTHQDASRALLECSAALNPRPWLLIAAFAAMSRRGA